MRFTSQLPSFNESKLSPNCLVLVLFHIYNIFTDVDRRGLLACVTDFFDLILFHLRHHKVFSVFLRSFYFYSL